MNPTVKLVLTASVTFALGVAAHALLPEAHAEGGTWKCYVVDRFPDMEKAAEWKGAVNYTTALNLIAPGTPSGTVMAANYPVSAMGGTQVGGAPIVCVKN